jgi:hypothetical protein
VSTYELLFLGLVIAAFTTFGVSLAWATWYERSWANKRAALPRRERIDAQPSRKPHETRRAA